MSAYGHNANNNYIYSWTVFSKPTGAADPLFSANNSTTSSTTATFSANGTYRLTFTVTDDFGDSFSQTTGNIVVTGVGGSAPAAPSGLSATPSGSNINLAWTDNSNNETGFHVWRSTDNINFNTIQT